MNQTATIINLFFVACILTTSNAIASERVQAIDQQMTATQQQIFNAFDQQQHEFYEGTERTIKETINSIQQQKKEELEELNKKLLKVNEALEKAHSILTEKVNERIDKSVIPTIDHKINILDTSYAEKIKLTNSQLSQIKSVVKDLQQTTIPELRIDLSKSIKETSELNATNYDSLKKIINISNTSIAKLEEECSYLRTQIKRIHTFIGLGACALIFYLWHYIHK